MTLPVEKISYPACLADQRNGELDEHLLIPTAGLAGGPTVRLVEPAARSWRAMTAAASAAGHTLKATSSADSYRDLDQQTRTFRIRYTRTDLSPRPYRWWDSDNDGRKEQWWQRPNTAVAAVPGTSNHGWGLAVDTGEEIDGDAGTESLDAATLAWLVANAWDYGWSWEVQSEAWHLRYCTGDAIPPAVLAYEEGDMTTLDDSHKMSDGVSRTYAKLIEDTWEHLFYAGYADTTPKSVQARLKTLLDRPPGSVTLTPEDRAAIVADLTEALTPLLAQVAAEARDAVADLGEGGAAQVRADT